MSATGITYKQQSDGSIRVLLNGRMTGTIRSHGIFGWQYKPKGQNFGGNYFDDVEDCKRSLESDIDDATPSTSAGGG